MFGIQPYAILFIFIILVLIYLLWSQGRNNKKQLKKYDGKFIALMWSNAGLRFYLAEEKPCGEVKLPDDYQDVDKTTITGSVVLRNPDKKDDKGNEVEEVYYTESRFMSPVWWPPEKQRKNQVRMQMTVFVAGIPLPIVGVNCKLWTSDMLSTLASTLLGVSADSATLESLRSDNGLWDNAPWIKKQLQKIGNIWYVVLAGAGCSAVAMFVVWQLASKIDKVLKMVGG